MPTMILDKTPSDKSEALIFENLKASRARDWIVFHSVKVNNPAHEVRMREIDFIILMPKLGSVICLEVKKGGYSARADLTPRSSAFEQSETAMFALKGDPRFKKHFENSSILSLGFANAFVTANISLNKEERRRQTKRGALIMNGGLVIEQTDAQTSENLYSKLNTYADLMRKKSVKSKEAEKKFQDKLQEATFNLQKDLETTMTVTIGPASTQTIRCSDLEVLREELIALTEQQKIVFETVRINNHCVVDGAAGTGKTVLALELAKQYYDEGKSVALLHSNLNLSNRFERWAETLLKKDKGLFATGTPVTLLKRAFQDESAFMGKHRKRLADRPNLEESLKSGRYLDAGWKPFIDETLEDLGDRRIFDYLIVDEAQNLCHEVFLKLMDAVLKGGLADGKWVMFGDFANQNIVAPRFKDKGDETKDDEAKDLNAKLKDLKDFRFPWKWKDLKDFRFPWRTNGISWSNLKLSINCRNTQEIIARIDVCIKIKSLTLPGVHGPEVQFEYIPSTKRRRELGNKLHYLVSSLKKREFDPGQIIVLTCGGDHEFNADRSYDGWHPLKISGATRDQEDGSVESVVQVHHTSSPKAKLRYSDVYDFQGLESDVVILILPAAKQVDEKGMVIVSDSEEMERMFYIGMSRAKAMLIIVAERSYEELLEPPSDQSARTN